MIRDVLKNSLLSALVAIVCQACSPKASEVQKPDWQLLANQLTSQATATIQARYPLKLMGIGGGMMRGVEDVTLMFSLYEPMDKERARELIVYCSQTLINEFQDCSEIQDHIYNPPFDTRRMHISIFSYDKPGKVNLYPLIAVVDCTHGRVEYCTKHPDRKYGYYTQETESYEEAVRIVEAHMAEST